MKKVILIEISPEQLQNQLEEFALKILSKQLDCINLDSKVDEVYYSRKQLSQLFQVQLSTIHNWVNKGILKRHLIGNRVYFKKSDVDAALIPLNR